MKSFKDVDPSDVRYGPRGPTEQLELPLGREGSGKPEPMVE